MLNKKQMVGEEAAKLPKDGQTLGLGTGTTVEYFLQALGQRVKKEKLDVDGVVTSYGTALAARKYGIRVIPLELAEKIDLAVDGADEVDLELNLMKGGGAALLREKIVASLAEEFVVIIEEEKLVKTLGESHPLPVEVVPVAAPHLLKKLEAFGTPKIREGTGKIGPVFTDNGNFVIDIAGRFPKPAETEATLKTIPGVVEVGTFVDLADRVLVGTEKGIKTLGKGKRF